MEREDINFYLQQVPMEEVFALSHEIALESHIVHIQKPTQQTLLLPVQDPITGGEFISGEVLVTSAIAQVDGVNGWAMVMDRNMELARAVAIIDGAFAAGLFLQRIEALTEQGRQILEEKEIAENQKVQDTRVSFDLM